MQIMNLFMWILGQMDVFRGGVLQKTKFFQRLNSKSLNLPSPRKPSGHSEELPYVFIGDEAFALRTDFIKLYPQRQSLTSSSKRIYNY